MGCCAHTGKQSFRGIPFQPGLEGINSKCWAALSTKTSSWTTTGVELPINQNANFVCIASFCDWDASEDPKPGQDVAERVGQQLAEAIFVYDDGSEQKFPLRRHFEVNAPSLRWGHLPFNSLSHRLDAQRHLTDQCAADRIGVGFRKRKKTTLTGRMSRLADVRRIAWNLMDFCPAKSKAPAKHPKRALAIHY